jgi:C_GCAxxG_C_C family probable redox protein
MTTPAERALSCFGQNFNCSQSVFSAFTPLHGIDEKTALKLASPFGGGFARQGHICGAVTGALLVLGLARGTEDPAGKGEIYRLGEEFLRRFEAKHGSLLCRALIACDISTPEGYQQAVASGVFKTICPDLVLDAVEITQSVLDATS